MGNHPQTTLIMFHDLLGFGSAVANAGGRFDSAIGEIAFKRIVDLKATFNKCKSKFPVGTKFIHFNDTVSAMFDVNITIEDEHNTGSGTLGNTPDGISNLLKFCGASAYLHNQIQSIENQERTGPGGRTIIVLGHRWKLPKELLSDESDIGMLSANLAFSEAYAAEASGFRVPNGGSYTDNIYINKRIDTQFMICGQLQVAKKNDATFDGLEKHYQVYEDIWPKLEFGDKPFPQNIYGNSDGKFEFNLFHKHRKFTSLNSLQTEKLIEAL